MTRRKTSAIDALSDQVVRQAGAETRREYLTGDAPTDRQRKSDGKGDEHRPVFVSPKELERRRRLLWVECPQCDRSQMRSERGRCIRCGARLPKAR